MPRESTAEAFTCLQCGVQFIRPGYVIRMRRKLEKPIKFCSVNCRAASLHDRAQLQNMTICQACGKHFAANESRRKRTGAKYCSFACAGYAKRRITTVDRLCRHCGKPFRVPKAEVKRGGGKFCSKRCFGQSKTKEGPGRRKIYSPMRRLVWKRDGGMCHICRRAVPYGPTYHCGHIVEQCLGGNDTSENLVVMCATCNLTKPRHKTREEYETWRLDR